MIKFIYGKRVDDNHTRLSDGTVIEVACQDDDIYLYRVGDGKPKRVDTENAEGTWYSTETTADGVVDGVTKMIRVNVVPGTAVRIPNCILDFVEFTGKGPVQYVPAESDTHTAAPEMLVRYGVYDGKGSVVFHKTSIPTDEVFGTGEMLYVIKKGVVVESIEYLGRDIKPIRLVEGPDGTCLENRTNILVRGPVGHFVGVPDVVYRSTKSFTFIPIHVNGEKDIVSPEERNRERFETVDVKSAIEKCKHLSGVEKFHELITQLHGASFYAFGRVTEKDKGAYTINVYDHKYTLRHRYGEVSVGDLFGVVVAGGSVRDMIPCRGDTYWKVAEESKNWDYIVPSMDMSDTGHYVSLLPRLVSAKVSVVLLEFGGGPSYELQVEFAKLVNDTGYRLRVMAAAEVALGRAPAAVSGSDTPLLSLLELTSRLL